MFGFGKKKVTSKEMAEGLWAFCRKFSRASFQELVPILGAQGHTLNKNDQLHLSRELIIINLWIISKALASDRAALDHLHEHYATGHANFSADPNEKEELVHQAKQEMLERYKQYHSNWNAQDPVNQALLASLMLQNMVGKERMGRSALNMKLLFPVQAHIVSMMKAVLEFRKGFDIRDGRGPSASYTAPVGDPAGKPKSAPPTLSTSQERRAIEILLEHIPEKVWTDLREALRAGKGTSDHFGIGMGIRNCLRLHGFLDNESPTGSLDDISEDLAIKAAKAAQQKDWLAAKKALPTRKMRADIQGFPRMLGERFWRACQQWSEEFLSELIRGVVRCQESMKKNRPQVLREVLIVTMWIMSDNWKGDKEVLEVMHDCFFQSMGAADEASPENPSTLKDINERYRFYFAGKNGGRGGFVLGLVSYIMRAGGSSFVDGQECELMNSYLERTIKGIKSLT